MENHLIYLKLQNLFDRYLNNTNEGLGNIKDLKYEIEEDSGFVNVYKI